MSKLLALCLSLFMSILTVTSRSNAEGISIDDLLIPETSTMTDQLENNQQLVKKPLNDQDIDDLLGAKDNFPFLPENHRDSGTGKFNAF